MGQGVKICLEKYATSTIELSFRILRHIPKPNSNPYPESRIMTRLGAATAAVAVAGIKHHFRCESLRVGSR